QLDQSLRWNPLRRQYLLLLLVLWIQ
ncbi:hypothetical protein PAT3040_00144, partial [Paenibacillus agaridevorans]